jgi:hypothetical protein
MRDVWIPACEHDMGAGGPTYVGWSPRACARETKRCHVDGTGPVFPMHDGGTAFSAYTWARVKPSRWPGMGIHPDVWALVYLFMY